ncbi:MAG: hypothetical protein AAFP08_04950 [Bacteroidota bacterium]
MWFRLPCLLAHGRQAQVERIPRIREIRARLLVAGERDGRIPRISTSSHEILQIE